MARYYVRCLGCRKIGVTAELLGHCRNAGLVPAGLSTEEAQRRDLKALRRKYRQPIGLHQAPRATWIQRAIAWLRSWIPE